MVAKKKVYKLDMFKEVIPAIDSKKYNFYDKLSDEEKKAFSAVVAMCWGASIKSSDTTLQQYALMNMNKNANTNLFNLYEHPKLQWLMIVAGSTDYGNYLRYWVSTKKTSNKTEESKKKILRDAYPLYKEDFPYTREMKNLSTMLLCNLNRIII